MSVNGTKIPLMLSLSKHRGRNSRYLSHCMSVNGRKILLMLSPSKHVRGELFAWG